MGQTREMVRARVEALRTELEKDTLPDCDGKQHLVDTAVLHKNDHTAEKQLSG